MYLLDTNHCSGILGNDPGIESKLSINRHAKLAISIMVRGELVFMAQNSERKEENLGLIRRLLSGFVTYDIDEVVADIYGKVKADLINKFGPKEKKQRRKYALHKHLGISDNDLWTAGVAIRNGLILLTNDESDFSRIAAVSALKKENWLKPH